jgi:hypothetical protein
VIVSERMVAVRAVRTRRANDSLERRRTRTRPTHTIETSCVMIMPSADCLIDCIYATASSPTSFWPFRSAEPVLARDSHREFASPHTARAMASSTISAPPSQPQATEFTLHQPPSDGITQVIFGHKTDVLLASSWDKVRTAHQATAHAGREATEQRERGGE